MPLIEAVAHWFRGWGARQNPSPGNPMEQQQLLEIARKFAVGNGYDWVEPVDVEYDESRGAWVVVTNAMSRGSNLRVVVEASSGVVIEHVFLPR